MDHAPRGPNNQCYGRAKQEAEGFWQAGPASIGLRVTSTPDGSTPLVALFDALPRFGREPELQQLIAELEFANIWLAARASYPEGGPKDGVVECLLFFAGDGQRKLIGEMAVTLPRLRPEWARDCSSEELVW